MGVVYEVTHLELEHRRALKVLAPALAQDDEFRQRFRHEWQVAASIDHPHVIPIYDAGECDGVMYITMRYVDGTDLAAEIARAGRLEPARAVVIIDDVASALDAAHTHGLVHRDVKPANILIEGEDIVYLTDFGLTKPIGSSGGLTRTGSFVGTVDYAAPEQISGHRVDARTDVYALAAVLCEALTGTVPFEGDSDVAKMLAIMSQPRPVLSERVPGLPPEIDSVVARAMAINPAYRYPSAGDFARAAHAAIHAHPVTVAERAVARGAAASTAPSSPHAFPPPSPPVSIAAQPPPPSSPPPSSPTVIARSTEAPEPEAGVPGAGARVRRWIPAGLAIALALAAVGVLIALLVGGGSGHRGAGSTARASTTPSPTALTLHPAGAPFTFSYPAGFKTKGINLTILTGVNGYAGLGADDVLGVTQSDVTTDTAGLSRNGITFTRRLETHGGLSTTVVEYGAQDSATNASYHERDYYFLIRGVSWDLTCAWTPVHAAQLQPACVQAINSIRVI
jgi:serine/threonine protein kinase